MHGMTFEIGPGGLSAATSGRLTVGDQVMYGFEFLAQPPEFQQQILGLCKTLPLFQTMADV